MPRFLVAKRSAGHTLHSRKYKEKARRAFFLYGNIGVFQGDLSPLSSRSVVELCVMPVLLFGCENWVMTSAMTEELESFQGELAKRMLKWPKHYSNTAAVIIMGFQSVQYRILGRKLRFLQRVLDSDSRSEWQGGGGSKSRQHLRHMSCQGVHGTGRVLWCDDHKGHAGRAEVVGQVLERGAMKIRLEAAPQEIQSEGSGSGNGAGACGVAEAVGLSNKLRNSAHQGPADAK